MPSNRPVQSTRRVSCVWKSPSPKISPEISPPCTFKKSSNFKGLREISPISPISPGCRGCVVSCARSHARKGASRKARLVTICHRLREWPFFLVLEGERRFDGFPFGWRRDAPKRAFFGRSRRCHRIDRCSAHAGYLARGNPGFRREACRAGSPY